MSLTIGARLGAYEIVSPLGAGGMGQVYRARDTRLDRDVAIKVLPEAFALDPERSARFQREAKTLAGLNHPNIAIVHGLEQTGGVHALVMELVEGEDLAERIERGAIALDDALPIAKQIAGALEAAHDHGIIHRDLKPANIKVRADGAVKVLDFGLAKAMEPASGSSGGPSISPTLSIQATQAGIILGTAAYMAPEQARGTPVDKRADIWAFGVVLYEMLTGSRLFEGATISDTLAAVLRAEPNWGNLPADTPVAIRRVLRRCLEKDPKRRTRDAGDVRLEIDEGLTAPGADLSVTEAGTRTRRRVAPFVIASVLGAALIAAFATWIVMRPTPAPLIRFNVDLGSDAIAGQQITVAISPDGRRIVFPIRGVNGTLQLATRLLDQDAPTPLAGTENGADPFFSPDGQWIAFGADAKLKKISVLGGSAVELCDATNLRGGSWGDDGTIVAALNSTTALFRVPEAGGTPQPLTRLTDGEEAHRWPQILPGSQFVLFTASKDRGQWEDATVQVLSVKTGQVTTLVHAGYFGRYLAGRLTYLHQGVLFGVAFDPKTMAVGGTPVPLLDGVASDPTTAAGQFDVSRTGTFVYRSGKGTAQGYPVVWLDSTGKTETLLPKPGAYQTLRVSPEGRRLALSLDTGNGPDIYSYDIAQGSLSQLTFNGRGNSTPVWAPDGNHIAYASTTDKTVWWIRADGAGEPQRLLESKNALRPTSFSPDGRYLAYLERTTPDAQADCWILPLDASDPERPKPGTPEVFLKTPASEAEANFSPDGRWLSYLSNLSGRTEVYVRPFHGSGGQRRISAAGGGSYSFWSRDGRTMYYLQRDGKRIMAVEYTASGESFNAGTPRVWSGTPVRTLPPGFRPLDLARDGRFAILPSEAVAEERGLVRATFLLNFFDELHRRLP